jgi:hypothetical protein
MFRLMKLAVMALLGYAIYEFFRGLVGYEMAQQSGQGGGQRSGGGQQEQTHLGSGNMQFSGPGEGQRVETEEASGTTTPHYVGRGVVQR